MNLAPPIIAALGVAAWAGGEAAAGPESSAALTPVTPGAQVWTLQLALGSTGGRDLSEDGAEVRNSICALGGLRYGITDRLTWAGPTLAFVYRMGDPGGVELIPFGGVTGWGTGYGSMDGWMFLAKLGGGAAIRFWGGESTSINLDVSALSQARWSERIVERGWGRSGPTTWHAATGVGLSHRVTEQFSVHAGVRASSRVIQAGDVDGSGFPQ